MTIARMPKRRMAYIDQQIRETRYPNCSTLARDLEVNRRTILRDIEYMRDQLGAPVEFDRCQNGYFYQEKNYYLPNVYLNQKETFALLVGEKLLAQYRDSPYFDELQKILAKIIDYISEPEQSLQPMISFEQRPTMPVKKDQIAAIQEAAQRNLQVEITYHALHRDRTEKRTIDPYSVINHHGNWYLIAFCHLRKDMRTFALNRIESYSISNNCFQRKKDFCLERYLGESFDMERGTQSYLVRLHFSAYQSRWIKERQWHKTQKIYDQEDGSLVLEMTVRGLSDLKRWVLYHGAEVEVLAPEELKKSVSSEIEKMKKIYRKKMAHP